MLRLAVYGRICFTYDKGQDPENQLRELREFVMNKVPEGWIILLWSSAET